MSLLPWNNAARWWLTRFQQAVVVQYPACNPALSALLHPKVFTSQHCMPLIFPDPASPMAAASGCCSCCTCCRYYTCLHCCICSCCCTCLQCCTGLPHWMTPRPHHSSQAPHCHHRMTLHLPSDTQVVYSTQTGPTGSHRPLLPGSRLCCQQRQQRQQNQSPTSCCCCARSWP